MLPSNDDRGRPDTNRTTSKLSDDDLRSVPSAELAMRIALLRVRADQSYRVDSTGWLAAQLRDLADLLECAEREGWFG